MPLCKRLPLISSLLTSSLSLFSFRLHDNPGLYEEIVTRTKLLRDEEKGSAVRQETTVRDDEDLVRGWTERRQATEQRVRQLGVSRKQ